MLMQPSKGMLAKVNSIILFSGQIDNILIDFQDVYVDAMNMVDQKMVDLLFSNWICAMTSVLNPKSNFNTKHNLH